MNAKYVFLTTFAALHQDNWIFSTRIYYTMDLTIIFISPILRYRAENIGFSYILNMCVFGWKNLRMHVYQRIELIAIGYCYCDSCDSSHVSNEENCLVQRKHRSTANFRLHTWEILYRFHRKLKEIWRDIEKFCRQYNRDSRRPTLLKCLKCRIV